MLQKGISPSPVSFWPSPKTTEARTSPITELVPHRSALTLSAIVSSRPIDSPQDLAVAGVLLAGVLLLLNRSLRDLVSLRDSFSSKSPKTTEARTSPITELVPHRSALTLSAIVSSRPIDSPQVCL
ncbi:hypothetical protein F2Q68_00021596 [Brassica cretica]|uniref:Uncharacterized protein n=1 Tax=Brassica cretica TaxID=69181 RepID=A0A8S9G4M9_BRACR|nr:hypothetical protein F2Q68_00021596 [Brassica cretica]